jgi:hypothetical protein
MSGPLELPGRGKPEAVLLATKVARLPAAAVFKKSRRPTEAFLDLSMMF